MATQYTCVCKTRYIIETIFPYLVIFTSSKETSQNKNKKHLLAETFSSTSLSRGLCSFDSLKDANLKECKKKEKWQKTLPNVNKSESGSSGSGSTSPIQQQLLSVRQIWHPGIIYFRYIRSNPDRFSM